MLLQLCLYLQDHPGLLDNHTGIVTVFELLRTKSMTSGDKDNNLALKFHYYSVLLKKAGTVHKENGTIQRFIKS